MQRSGKGEDAPTREQSPQEVELSPPLSKFYKSTDPLPQDQATPSELHLSGSFPSRSAMMLGSTDSITSESFAARQRHTTTPIDVQDPVEYSTGTTLDAVGGGNQPALQTLPHNLTGYDAPAAEPPLSAESPDIVAIIDGGGEIQDRINSFFEVVAPTMNALDEIAKVHPMIGALVMSFKTVYTLELRRRRNDKKVLAVYLAMTDMMSILLKLKTMPRIEENPQIQQLIRLTIEDIKQCSNTCDAYAKKKLLVKTVQSGLWNKKLLHFVSLFEKRREQFAIALSIQVHLAVHDTIAKISQIDRSDMLAAFQRLASPEEDQLAELIKTKGGVLAVEKNDLALQELLTVASKATDNNDTELGQYRRSGLNAAEIAALKEDLSENPDAAVEKNSDVFTRKLEVQTRQISEALSLRREGERVIKEVRFRPHDRTSGELQSIRELWEKMGWEDEVNGDEFVPALLRHYAIKFEPAPGSSKDGAMGSEEIDTWAISAIDAAHFRLISEAFDNDVSGTITTAELNVFAISRPRYWSLLHWLAFWAIGWKSSMIWYANRLEDLFARIEGIYSQVLAPNREVVAFYQAKVRRLLHTFTSTLRGEEYAPHWDKFSTYVEEQEKLLIANLQTIDYSIDAVDTIALVTGENRLEKVLFPLLFLLVKHHHDIIKKACKKATSERELLDATQSIDYVLVAVRSRVQYLDSKGDLQRVHYISQGQNASPNRTFHRPQEAFSAQTSTTHGSYSQSQGSGSSETRATALFMNPTAPISSTSETSGAIETLSGRVDELSRQVDDVRDRIDDLSSGMANISSRMDTMSGRVDEIHDRMGRLEVLLQRLVESTPSTIS